MKLFTQLFSVIVVLVPLFQYSEQDGHHAISKRRVNYSCSSHQCTNGVCTNKSYNGPNPPDWCRQSAGSRRSSSSWSRHCDQNGCSHKSNFKQSVQSNHGQSTFNVDCAGGTCSIKSCNRNACGSPRKMSQSELERDIQGMPRCNGHGRRKKRSFISRLIGYCCDITDRWDGHRIINIRPTRSASFG